MAITAFKRRELKFMLSPSQFEALLPQLEEYMQPDAYCCGGRAYSIYNLYYDTRDHYLIRQSLSKPYYKEKLRMRSYKVPTSPDDRVFLELKKKSGGIVSKRRAVLTYQEAADFVASGCRPDSAGYMNEQVAREIEYFLSRHPVGPAACISYRRLAFFGREDRDFRLTFDYDILTSDDVLAAREGRGGRLIDGGQRLMEIKINTAVPMWLAHLCSELKIYKTSFSKYGRAYQKICREQAQPPQQRLFTRPGCPGLVPQLTDFHARLSAGY